MKKVICLLLVLILIITVCGCSSSSNTNAETDIFGLYSTFNYFGKQDNWEQYSTSSDFQFSSEDVYDYSEEVEDADGNVSVMKYYNRDFGTFPAIAAIGYGKILAYEFARQHCDLGDDELSTIAQVYPIYTSPYFSGDYYNTLHKESGASWGGCIVKQTFDKTVFLDTDRPADILFDVSGIPVDETQIAFEDLLSNIEYDTVCYDSMVFFTDKSNTVNSLTSEQVRGIYSGKIKNWSVVGGDDKEIEVYHRGGSTMNNDYMQKVIMKDLKIKKTNFKRLKQRYVFYEETYYHYPIEYQHSENSIGYGYKSLVERYYGDSVKILDIDNVSPTDENVRSEKYAFSIPCYAVTRKGKSGKIGKKVIEWLKSDEGKKSVQQIGFVAVGNQSEKTNITTVVDSKNAPTQETTSTEEKVSSKNVATQSRKITTSTKSEYLTKLYSNNKTSSDNDKMQLLNNRLEFDLPIPNKIIGFYNNDECLYAVLEYSEKQFDTLKNKKWLGKSFDCYAERNEKDYENQEIFDPIYKPLNKQSWWEISVQNKNVVASFSKSFDLCYSQKRNSKSVITAPNAINTAIYFEKSDGDTYKAYCALESHEIYCMKKQNTFNDVVFGDK